MSTNRTVWSMVGRWLVYVRDEDGRDHQLDLPAHMKAEAHKLGAAHDLYEALAQIEGRVEEASDLCHNSQQWRDAKGLGGEPTLWDWVFAPARAALAKARGDQ